MLVTMRAMDDDGNLISGPGVRNPFIITLGAGQQSARMIPEIFGIGSFDGWIEIEASAPGLGVYTATGSPDAREMDGGVARELSPDFVLFQPAATAILINPSSRLAEVTITDFGSGASRSLTIPPRGKITTALSESPSRIRSSEPLAAIERTNLAGCLALGCAHPFGLGAAVPVSAVEQTLVFPHAVAGGGYQSILTLANVSPTPQAVTVAFGTASRTVRLRTNESMRVSLADFLQLPDDELKSGAARVTATFPFSSAKSLVGTLAIANATGFVIVNPRGPATENTIAHVAQGNGWYTGIALAAGAAGANVAVDVFPAAGGTPKSATLSIGPDEHIAAVLSELVPGVTAQMGGYIKVRSDQPIWVWGAIGSSEMIAAAPPLGN
jgi:hypothetical protein